MKPFYWHHRAAPRLCSLCGCEIPVGDCYWFCNGSSVCAACLPTFAQQELAPYRQVRGREGL